MIDHEKCCYSNKFFVGHIDIILYSHSQLIISDYKLNEEQIFRSTLQLIIYNYLLKRKLEEYNFKNCQNIICVFFTKDVAYSFNPEKLYPKLIEFIERMNSQRKAPLLTRTIPKSTEKLKNACSFREVNLMIKYEGKTMIIKFINTKWEMLYIILMTIFAIIMIICNVIAKNGWDLFVIATIVWLLCSIYIPKYTTTRSRTFIILVFFIFLDGIIDSLSTGFWNWIGYPWILWYNYGLYPLIHPLSVIYLVTLWIFSIPIRSLIIGKYFVINYYNVDFNDRPQRFEKIVNRENKRILLFYFTGLVIVMSFICDWINFLVRPEIPDFENYIPPLGLWTPEKMAIRTTILLIVGVYCFYLAVQEKETKGSSILILLLLILIISSVTFLIAFI